MVVAFNRRPSKIPLTILMGLEGDSDRLTWCKSKWQAYSNLTGMCLRATEVSWIILVMVCLRVPCDSTSGLIYFCLLHISLRSADLLQYWAQHRHAALYKHPSNTFEAWVKGYSKGKFWIYCANYAYGRWVLLHCQRCVSPLEAGTTWWLSPSWASDLGVTAHIFIWVDTVVWLMGLVLERIPWIKAVTEVEPVIFGGKDASSVDSTLSLHRPHRLSIDNLLPPTPGDSINDIGYADKPNFSPVWNKNYASFAHPTPTTIMTHTTKVTNKTAVHHLLKELFFVLFNINGTIKLVTCHPLLLEHILVGSCLLQCLLFLLLCLLLLSIDFKLCPSLPLLLL